MSVPGKARGAVEHRKLSIESEIAQMLLEDQSSIFQQNPKSSFWAGDPQPQLTFHDLRFYSACLLLGFCWLTLALCAGIIIGTSASNYSQRTQYGTTCSSQETCSIEFELGSSYTALQLYATVTPYYPNNLYYRQTYNELELAGLSTTGCPIYNKVSDFGVNTSLGGYYRSPNAKASPCGSAVKELFNDSYVIVSTSGSIFPCNYSSLTQAYYNGSVFVRAKNYLASQWKDVQDSIFMNWFTVSSTPQHRLAVCRVDNIPQGKYQVIIYNNYKLSTGQSKILSIQSTNSLGVNDYVFGLSVLCASMYLFITQVYLCCRKKSSSKN